jgi:hypothetical protein
MVATSLGAFANPGQQGGLQEALIEADSMLGVSIGMTMTAVRRELGAIERIVTRNR